MILQRLEVRLGAGLSAETCGRECVFVTPRSDSSSATDLLVIELPRSA